MKRRTFLHRSVLGGIAASLPYNSLISSATPTQPTKENTMPFKLPELPYAPDALEPFIDKMTMEIHHGKHHNAYVTNLNKAIENTEWNNKTIEEILANVSKLPPA